MTLPRLLDTLRAKDIVLILNGQTLRYNAPKGAMTAELLQDISQHKDALLELWEERAAIAEHCGGLSRADAERLAWQCLLEEVPT